MTKKQAGNASDDSDELQALFDSIASEPPPVAKPATISANDSSGDDSDLQALFDAVASEFDAGEDDSGVASDGPVAQVVGGNSDPDADKAKSDKVFNRLGVMTRQVNDTLRALGADSPLQEAVNAMPDARQRLNYITQMTEQAASRVLNATDIAKPLQDKITHDAQVLGDKWDKAFANQLTVDEFKALATETRDFIARAGDSSKATSDQLLKIMMAQDFQDLTGQVIKKVVDLAQKLETELLGVLIEAMPPEKLAHKSDGLLNGPVIDAKGRDDVVTTQDQVDDLLDSLGF